MSTEHDMSLQVWNMIIEEVRNNPIVNTVVFTTNENIKNTKMFEDTLSLVLGRRIYIEINKPSADHPDGDVYMAYVYKEGEKKVTLEEVFNNCCVKNIIKIQAGE